MAKAPDTIERFRIHADTSQERVGGILAVLTKLGVDNIGFEIITDVASFRHNGARKDHGPTSEQFATEWIKNHPTFRAQMLMEHFVRAERSGRMAYTALQRLAKKGAIKALGAGNYRRADAQPVAPAKGTHGGARQRHGVSNPDLVRRFVGSRQKFMISELASYFEQNGRRAHSAYPIASKMVAEGIFKNLGAGQYEVLKPGAKNGKAAANG